MGILRKLKETALSVAPLMFLVLAVQGGVSSFSIESTGGFVVGGLLVVAGLALFLLGTDLGPAAIGDRIGAALVKKRSLPLILAAGFGSGFIITIAEPAVQVLASQVYTVDPSIYPNRLLLNISLCV